MWAGTLDPEFPPDRTDLSRFAKISNQRDCQKCILQLPLEHHFPFLPPPFFHHIIPSFQNHPLPNCATEKPVSIPMTTSILDENHFLSLARPDVLVGPQAGAPDTTTLAAHDFDVDTRTGFMPPHQPLMRLPDDWAAWEDMLDSGVSSRLQLGCKVGLSEEEAAASESWRQRIREVCVSIFTSTLVLRHRPCSFPSFRLPSSRSLRCCFAELTMFLHG